MNRVNSYDSGQRPLTSVQYSQAPYQDQYYNSSNAYLTRPPPPKKGLSKWVKFGIPLIIIVIIAAVVGAIFAVRAHNNSTAAAASGASASGSGSGSGAKGSGSGGSGGQTDIGIFPTATDSYFLPVYPSTTNAALYVTPTFAASPTASWPAETFTPATPDPKTMRGDRPRLIAPAAKWQALPDLIEKDPYLNAYHNQILKNATIYHGLPVVAYVVDGGSGILDVSRQVKERIKAYAYSYRMTNDTQWLDAAWKELQNAAGNTTAPFGTAPDRWNSGHFLDVAEMTSAFAIAYDWLYDAWMPEQRTAIMWSIIETGLSFGITQYTTSAGWWTGSNGEVISGNWNCVNNAGMTMGALAIFGDDPTGISGQILDLSIPNANKNCVFGPSSDGSWTETPNYWYFGTTGHAEMVSALQTATGGTYGLLDTNPNFNLTGLYHMYVFGMTSLFDYADHGPNKYSTTANAMMLYATAYDTPMYMLYQRDRFDAAEPWAMFWYDLSVAGAWWNGLALDHQFNDAETYWASMRSSWTDNTGLYIAMKSSKLTGHQTHGDLDCGDFALDAMGQRWAGELGSGNYLSTEYFTSELDNADRWLYYRKRTEGQNTLVIGTVNQLAVEAAPTVQYGSSGTVQGSSTILDIGTDSTAFFTTDMSTAYGSGSSVLRGIRMINGRKQVLLQDDVTTTGDLGIQWRMHTNATVVVDTSGTSATLTLNSKTLQVLMVNPPAGAAFTTGLPVRLATDPPVPTTSPEDQDQLNKGVTVLIVDLPAGTHSLQVLFNPMWDGMSASDFVTPASVPVSQWNLLSHH
jgi:hypothetical protein